MCGAQGSKVLVTTRSKTVAQTVGVSDPYVLDSLTQEKSWDLLKKITFGNDTIGVDRTLEPIGKKIAEKCRGVPLAIRSLGGILQSKSEEREWIDVLLGYFWKLCEDKDSIMPVLKLSYENLSPQLKQCFAYCSLYPKDWVFEKDELVQMWMAQGYLECSVEEKCMDDVGNQFVNTFLMKSFFQDAKMNLDGDIDSFRMHDLMHDLATQVAGNDCCYLDSKTKRCLGKPVHVSVELDAFCLLESLDASRLRTLIMLHSHYGALSAEKLSVISNFKYLRVLKLRFYYLSKLSGSIEKLKHLRYLNLFRCHGLESLPKSIENLVCLQTIKVTLDEKVVLSTKVISKLINLRHLEINDWICRDKTQSIGFEKLSIQNHEGVMFSKWLSSLTNIIEISLSYCQGVRYLPPLERLPFLKSLKLRCLNDLECIYYKEPIHHESFFPSLESLQFYNCEELRGWRKMEDDFDESNSSHHFLLPKFSCLSKFAIRGCEMLTCMPSFPNIKNVDFFSISKLQFAAIEMWFKDDLIGFPSLKRISFYNCSDLKALPDWICNFSSLQHIKIIKCHKLASLPDGMPRLTNLRTLEIFGCLFLVEECLTKTSATWPKIGHIPNIIIK